MNFNEIAKNRQSCRAYDPALAVEHEKFVQKEEIGIPRGNTSNIL